MPKPILFVQDIADFDQPVDLPPALEQKCAILLSEKAKLQFRVSYYLKKKLATHLGLKEVTLRYNPYGKPALVQDHMEIPFSISHHDNLVVLCFTGAPVGVDIINPDSITLSSFQCPYFSPEEQARIQTKQEFCKLWAAKEAYGKYLGCGLHEGLSGINLFDYPVWRLGSYLICIFPEQNG